MVSFYAGLIMSAINGLHLKLDDHQRMLEDARQWQAATAMATTNERFVETPARPLPQAEPMGS